MGRRQRNKDNPLKFRELSKENKITIPIKTTIRDLRIPSIQCGFMEL